MKSLLSIIAALVFIAIFAFIMNVAYLPTRVNVNSERAIERKAYLVKLQADETKIATTYAWVDQKAGIVRLPLERAKEVVLADLKKKQIH